MMLEYTEKCGLFLSECKSKFEWLLFFVAYFGFDSENITSVVAYFPFD